MPGLFASQNDPRLAGNGKGEGIGRCEDEHSYVGAFVIICDCIGICTNTRQ